MKKSLLILTAALTFGGFASAQLAPSAAQVPALTDVPAGHWAKDAIDRLVSRGIILGYPDGTFRGTKNLTRYEASIIIARLLDQMNSGVVVAPQGEDLTALQNAVQELSADLAALGVRVSDLEANSVSKDDFSRLEARVEALGVATGNPEALVELQARMEEMSQGGDYEGLRTDIDDMANSITALNDLSVLLNQDILDLQDRVSALESARHEAAETALNLDTVDGRIKMKADDLNGRIDGLETRLNSEIMTRIQKAEMAPKFSVYGGIDTNYGNLQLIDGNKGFDVDRLTEGTFAKEVYSKSCTTHVTCVDVDNTKEDGKKQVRAFLDDSEVVLGIKASNLATKNGVVVVDTANVEFGIENAFGRYFETKNILDPEKDTPALKKGENVNNNAYISLKGIGLEGTIADQKFKVNYNNSKSTFKFNDYLFNNTSTSTSAIYRRGVVAELEATKLPLSPKITVVAGTSASKNTQKNNFDGNYYGIRSSINPTLGTVGLSFAHNDAKRTALGVDFDLGFGTKFEDPATMKTPAVAADAKKEEKKMISPFTVSGLAVLSAKTADVYFNDFNKVSEAFKKADRAIKLEARATLPMVKVAGQFLQVSPAFAHPEYKGTPLALANGGDSAGMSLKAEKADANNYGVAASTNAGPVALGGYFDSTAKFAANSERTNSFGVAAGVQLRALKLVGFYNSSKKGNAVVNSGKSFTVDKDYLKVAYVPFLNTSTTGVALIHDGKATNAFVPGLNFTIADGFFYNSKVNSIQAYGNYEKTLAGIKLEPFARFNMLSAPDNTRVDEKDVVAYNTLKYGIKASVEPLTAVPLAPSVYGNFAQRKTNITAAAKKVIDETFFQVGVSVNRLFVDDLKASVGYSYYTGSNVKNDSGIKGAGSNAFSTTVDRIYSDPTSSDILAGGTAGEAKFNLNGLFAQADWNGFQANYGIFHYTDQKNANPEKNVAQAFKVGYNFKF